MLCSDKPGHHDFNLLKKLLLSDGSILRAKLPGRPTRDCFISSIITISASFHIFFHVIGILYMLMIGDSLSISTMWQVLKMIQEIKESVLMEDPPAGLS